MLWTLHNLHEYDGKFRPQRLLSMTAIEMLNRVYADLMSGAGPEERAKINAALEGRLGPGGGILVDDPTLPEGLQGMEAPSWWSADQDPMSDQVNLSNVKMAGT